MTEQASPVTESPLRGFITGFIESLEPAEMVAALRLINTVTAGLVKLSGFVAAANGHAIDAADAVIAELDAEPTTDAEGA